MLRALRISLFVLTAAAALIALAWYLAFSVGLRMPGQVEIKGLSGAGRIEWLDTGAAVVRVAGAGDTAAAIGTVHALSDPWTLFLLRQASLGRLSEWFGEETARLDRHVLVVGIPSRAEKDWSAMDDAVKNDYTRYADGINAALRHSRVRDAGTLTTIGVIPDPWEPWHSLAVEQLVLWLATSMPADSVVTAVATEPAIVDTVAVDSTSIPRPADSLAASLGDLIEPVPAPVETRIIRPAVRNDAFDVLRADRDALSDFLALGGIEHAAVWTVGPAPEAVFARYVWGASALPPIQAVRVESAGSARELITWTGSPLPLAVRDADGIVASIPASRLELRRAAPGPDLEWRAFDVADLRTEVVERHLDGDWISVGEPDDHLSIAWGSSATGPRPTLGSSAIRIGRTGPTSVTGPVAAVEVGSIVLLSTSDEATELARSIDRAGIANAALLDESVSQWAADGLPVLLDSLRADSLAAYADSDAVEYLRNWNASYDGSSIGATLYEPVAGTMTRVHARLVRVVDSLTSVHGTDRRTWRWERDSTAWLRVPGGPGGLVATPIPDRYGPIAMARKGHPTTPIWGSSPRWVGRPAPAAWEAFIPRSQASALSFRRPSVPYDRFLGRYSSSPEATGLQLLKGPVPDPAFTSLVPRS